MPSIIVSSLSVATDAEWSFRDSLPRFQLGAPHGHSATFDPFPCYPHDRAVVEDTVGHVEARFPPRWDVYLYIVDREEGGRSNGYSNVHESGHYDDSHEWVPDPPVGLIVLSGKRVPPHPAVSKYLVAHEYGHNVEYMLTKARSPDGNAHDQALITEYAKVRGLPEDSVHHGSGGAWHDSATEIFACDFRIVICGMEADYWPHPGITHPYEVEAIVDWWGAVHDDWGSGVQT